MVVKGHMLGPGRLTTDEPVRAGDVIALEDGTMMRIVDASPGGYCLVQRLYGREKEELMVPKIGRIRRALMVPWRSKWNALVRDFTAWLERKGLL